jgi:hypothetical protein
MLKRARWATLPIDILEYIFTLTEAVGLLRLSCTCQRLHNAYRAYAQRAFSINKRLSRFFRDPVKFRTVQARGGTLISGSFALQFFDRSFYAESDLDLYLHPGEAKALGTFLVSEGYSFVPRPSQIRNPGDNEPWKNGQLREDWEEEGDYGDRRRVRCVYTFVRSDGDEDIKKVQLVVAYHTPMDAVLGFHSC